MANGPLMEHPINRENEALILVSAIKNEKLRDIFIKMVPYDKFRVNEFKCIAWGIIEASKEQMVVDIDAIRNKAASCPVRYLVEYNFLVELVANFEEVDEVNFKVYIETLSTDFIKAKLAEWSLQTMYTSCTDSRSKLEDLSAALTRAKEIIEQGYSSSKVDFQSLAVIGDRFEEDKKKGIDKRSTGFFQLDHFLTEGFKEGQITTIAALSSMGKSSFLLSIMKNLGNLKIPSAQFALEMNSTSLFAKLLAFNARLPISTILKKDEEIGNSSQFDYQMYKTELTRLKNNKYIWLNDKPSQSIASIREQLLIFQDFMKKMSTDNSGYLVVPIDLFGKLRDFQGSDNFARDYEKKCNEIQVLTRELGVHMILVAQINREVSKRKNKRPTMNDLKNAHALTEVSDIILGIHRPFYDPDVALKHNTTYGVLNSHSMDSSPEEVDANANPHKNVAEAIILKQRMGINNVIVNYMFDPETTCFRACTEEENQSINENKFEEIE